MAAIQGMRQPSWRNYWGWGSGDMLGAGAQAVVTGWLFYFFVTFCGLSAVESGVATWPKKCTAFRACWRRSPAR